MRPVVVAMLSRALGRSAHYLVPTYTFMLALGCLLGAALVLDAGRRHGLSRQKVATVLLVAYLSGLAGAAAVPFAQALGALITEGHLRFRSGIAAYGGLFGGVVGGSIAALRLGLPLPLLLDLTAPSLGLGYCCARLGCFLAGCDYGLVTGVGWAVRFPLGSHAHRDHVARGLIDEAAPWSLPVHPTQLYLSLTGLSLYLAVGAMPAKGDGRRFFAYVVGYAVMRSGVELLRGDEGRGSVGPLSTSQLLALVSVPLAALLLRRARATGQPPEGSQSG